MTNVRTRTQCRHAGYSLTELIIAVSILAILGLLANPNIMAMRRRHNLDEAVSRLVSELRVARAQAVSESSAVVVGLDTMARTLTLKIDRNANGTYESDEQSVVTISNSRGVSITSTLSQGVFRVHEGFTCSEGYWKIGVSSQGAEQEFVYVFAGGQVERSKSSLK